MVAPDADTHEDYALEVAKLSPWLRMFLPPSIHEPSKESQEVDENKCRSSKVTMAGVVCLAELP